MSVIVTGMDLPSKCAYCDAQFNYECRYTRRHCKDFFDKRSDDCPMKSIEGLIEEVNNMCDDADVFTLTTEFMNNRISMEDFIDAIGEFYRKEVAGIIKGYCEVNE